MALNLIILGAPGAGKGTQAERFALTRGIPKISTGDMLREAVKAGTDIGLRAKAIMNRGELVSDDVMIDVVRERLTRPNVRPGFILDGFPRTVAQAAAFDRIMEGRDPLIVIDIEVPEAELVRRLSSRRVCEDCGANEDASETSRAPVDSALPLGSVAGAVGDTTGAVRSQSEPTRCHRCGGRLKQRSDDSEAVVLERLRVYRRDTHPLVEYYRPRPSFRAVDGAQAPERVATDLAAAILAASEGPGVVQESGGLR